MCKYHFYNFSIFFGLGHSFEVITLSDDDSEGDEASLMNIEPQALAKTTVGQVDKTIKVAKEAAVI